MNEISLVKRVKYAGDIHTELLKSGWDLDTATTFVNNIPDADVAPVIHAKYKANGIAYLCSHCHKSIVIEQCDDDCEMNYCINCGAKMDLEG